MYLMYTPYNLFQWGIHEKFLPLDAKLAYGRIVKTVMSGTEDGRGYVRIVVEDGVSPAKQIVQVLTGMATYHVIYVENRPVTAESAKVVADSIYRKVEEYAKAWSYLSEASYDDVEKYMQLSNMDGVYHPVLLCLSILEGMNLLQPQSIVHIGEELGLNDYDLSIAGETIQEQMGCLLRTVRTKHGEDVERRLKESFCQKWNKIRADQTDGFVYVPEYIASQRMVAPESVGQLAPQV